MVKTVTYGIQYTRADNLVEGYKYHLSKYNTYLGSNNRIKAAEMALELIEWLEADYDELSEESEQKYMNVMRKSIDLSKKAIRILEGINYKSLLPRAHKSIGQSYLVLSEYETAIHHGKKAIELLQELQSENQTLVKMKSHFQITYRMLGNTYFTKSNHETESRYSDFENARQYYQLEREILNTMTLDDLVDPEDDDIKRLIQSSNFNLGVMEGKILHLHDQAEANLRRAITTAQALKDYPSEKSAWWELGNLYKRMKQYDLVKQCQKREYALAVEQEYDEDQAVCFEERMKFHMFLNEYNECGHLYKSVLDADIESTHVYENIFNMVKRVKNAKEHLDALIKGNNINSPTTALFLEFIQMLQKFKLYRMIVQYVDENLFAIVSTRDFAHLTYAEILQYKTEAQWKLRENPKEDYLKSSNEAFDYVEAYFLDSPLNRAHLTVSIFKLRTKIHEYYEQDFQMDSCKRVLTEAIKEERILKQKLENNYNMDVTFPDHKRILPVFNKDSRRRIRARILFPTPKDMMIQYDPIPETVQKLMDDLASRCWNEYGIEPIISHMRTLDHDIYPQDYIRNIITKDGQLVEATVNGTVKKSPLQVYINSSSRLNVGITREIQLKLSKDSFTSLSLAELGTTKKQLGVIQQVLQHTSLLQTLNLSSTMLTDDDLVFLLEHANKGLSELHVCNNRITVKSLDKLSTFRLRTLDLSHNPLGPTMLKRLPIFLSKVPSLKQLTLENTDIGRYLEIDEALEAIYSNYSRKASQGANLALNISSNYFHVNMLTLWTPLWLQIKRIFKLDLSSISTDGKWLNFDLLSDLPKLSDLIFSYTISSTLNYNFRSFFKSKSQLNHVDFTGCGLNLLDMMVLSNSLHNISKLRKLTLNSNPDIGDAGMVHLDGVIRQSKIDLLDISDCGITSNSVDCVLAWTNHLKQIDATKNPEFELSSDRVPQTLTCLLKVDSGNSRDKGKAALVLQSQQITSSMRSTFGLSFQPMDILPETPF